LDTAYSFYDGPMTPQIWCASVYPTFKNKPRQNCAKNRPQKICSIISNAAADCRVSLKFGCGCVIDLRRLQSRENTLPVESRLAEAPNFRYLNRHNLTTDCLISIECGTELNHVTVDTLKRSKSRVKGQGNSVT